jgi:ketose-bisphosphate aldolase
VPLVSMTGMLQDAQKTKTAVGAFMVWNHETARAAANAAQRLGRPVILLLGVRDAIAHGGFRRYVDILRHIVDDVDVPIAFHADHFTNYEEIIQAMVGGYSSVMIDASRYPIEDNIRRTKEVVKVAHACGVSVEAELGRLPGNEGDEEVTVSDAYQTDPDEACYFAEETGIDALAVTIGTAHGTYKVKPVVNIERIKKIASKVPVPLVMHGGSGTPEAMMVEAIRCGICKINVATDIVTILANTIVEAQKNPSIRYKTNLIFDPALMAVERLIEDRIKLFGRMK